MKVFQNTRQQASILTFLSALLVLVTACSALHYAGQAEDRENLFDPVALFLTWQHDPSTSMTIDWHTTPDDQNRNSDLQFRKAGEDEWRNVTGNEYGFPHSDRTIHRVELRGLEPSTTYHFRFGENSKVYHFETMPADLSEPLQFATGGDTVVNEKYPKMNRVVMEYDPAFILWGGDLAYADGDPLKADHWYRWFDVIKETLITEEGRVVPIVVAIGNHERFSISRPLRGNPPHDVMTEEEVEEFMTEYNVWQDKVTYFFDLFAFPGTKAYNVLDFADYMSIVLLDSDHHSTVIGGQTGWLDAILEERVDRNHVFPVYHVPAYPSHRRYEASVSTRIRENWVPLFEKHGIRIVFENHDHTYKRTHPIRNGEISEDGVTYIGDGSWSAGPREGNNRNEWYISEFASENHGIIVNLHGSRQHFLMVNIDGEIIDEYLATP